MARRRQRPRACACAARLRRPSPRPALLPPWQGTAWRCVARGDNESSARAAAAADARSSPSLRYGDCTGPWAYRQEEAQRAGALACAGGVSRLRGPPACAGANCTATPPHPPQRSDPSVAIRVCMRGALDRACLRGTSRATAPNAALGCTAICPQHDGSLPPRARASLRPKARPVLTAVADVVLEAPVTQVGVNRPRPPPPSSAPAANSSLRCLAASKSHRALA